MYLENRITIDPSQLTKIERIKPTKAFKKLLFSLTNGVISDKEERETFNTIAILQQINATLRSLGITNIIKISHDDIIFYLDEKGEKDDLKFALDKYEIEINDAMSIHFKTLELVLEHEDENFKYIIEIIITKNHKVGVYPIEIKTTGLFKNFKEKKKSDKIKQVLKDQTSYDNFRSEKITQLEKFTDTIRFELKKQIKIDDTTSFTKSKQIVVKKRTNQNENTKTGPVFANYYGFEDYVYYNFIWSEIIHDQSLELNDIYFENEHGEDLGHSNTINSDSDLFNGEDAIIANEIINSETDESDSDSGSSWFDFGDFNDFGSDSDSSCSSCSSCGGD
ncbi:MAG: hypothetical protein ABJL44_16390 [Algibacter sp.]